MDVMIREQVIRNSDGSYTIFLNSRITWEAQLLAYRHALGHIINGDFEKESADHIAVSYTHLDVYKRQPSACVITNMRKFWCSIPGLVFRYPVNGMLGR